MEPEPLDFLHSKQVHGLTPGPDSHLFYYFNSLYKNMKSIRIWNLYEHRKKLYTWVVEQKPNILEDQKGCVRGCEEFKYLGIKIDKDRQENYIKTRINKCRAITSMLNVLLWNRQMTRKKQITNM